MSNLPSLLESTATIRFQDCDPYNHLNNAKYIDYFMNAREDQVLEAYGLDIYHLTLTTGKAWVVAYNQVAYVQPAVLMERVKITSCIIEVNSRWMTVEFQMRNGETDRFKSLMWTKFVYADIRTGGSVNHGEEFMEMFRQVLHPVEEKTFVERLGKLKSLSR